METSLYQEGEPDRLQEMKKNMFLPLDFASGSTKQQKYANLLGSPDFNNMLAAASPELEKLILASTNGLLQTPTPRNSLPTPTQFLNPKSVTEEQEAYARGFVEALAQLHGEISGQTTPILPQTVPFGSNSDNKQTAGEPVDQSSSGASDVQQPPTYSQLMPMSLPNSSVLAASTATTLANMSGLTSAAMSKRPYQFIPSGLATASKPPTSTIPSATSLGYAQNYAPLDIQVKGEPSGSYSHSEVSDPNIATSLQASPTPSSSRVSDSPALSPSSTVNMDNDNTMPIDMNDQEQIKVERKRARNRIAARKCRTRKLERISRLEEKVNDLKTKNNELLAHATSLSDQVVQLKQQIVDHMKTGCQIMMPNVQSLGQT